MPVSKSSYQPYQSRVKTRWIMIIAVVLVAYVAGIASGWYLLETTGRRVLEQRKMLSEELASAREESKDLKRQIAIFENAGRVDRMAAQSTQDDLRGLQDKLAEVGKELEFYKRIISPEHRNYELRIDSLKLFDNGGYKYVLTVSQGIGRDNSVDGTARMHFRGTINGENYTLSLVDVDAEKRNKLRFSFRYFQTLSGALELPDGFILESIAVKVKSSGGGSEEISREWTMEELQVGEE